MISGCGDDEPDEVRGEVTELLQARPSGEVAVDGALFRDLRWEDGGLGFGSRRVTAVGTLDGDVFTLTSLRAGDELVLGSP